MADAQKTAAQFRAQIPTSTDPDYLEQMALAVEAADAEADRVRAVVSGLICSSCDEPITAGCAGPECAECASIVFTEDEING